MANPCPQPDLVVVSASGTGMVKTKDGVAQYPPGSVANFAPVKAPPKRVTFRTVFPTADMLLIAKMHKAVKDMFAVLRRMPGTRAAGCRSQLAAITESGTEPCDDPPKPRPLRITSAEIDLMEAAYEAVMIAMREDDWGAKLVVGRALDHPWKKLIAEDPQHRNRAMQAFIRNNALYRMATSEAGVRTIAVLDTIALDKLDRIGA